MYEDKDLDLAYLKIRALHNVLYQKKFIINNKIKFNTDLLISQDSLFNYQARECTKNINFSSCPGYFYRFNNIGLSRGKTNKAFSIFLYYKIILSKGENLNKIYKLIIGDYFNLVRFVKDKRRFRKKYLKLSKKYNFYNIFLKEFYNRIYKKILYQYLFVCVLWYLIFKMNLYINIIFIFYFIRRIYIDYRRKVWKLYFIKI